MSEPVQSLPSKPPPNGMSSVLTSLAHSTDRWVQLGTLALIAFSGVGNWVATWDSADRNKEQIEINRRVAAEGEARIRTEVIRQVQDIHGWLFEAADEFHKGNEDSATNRKLLNQVVREDLENFEKRQQAALDNQNTIMKSQTKVLENDTVLIKEIHYVVEGFERWKNEEQMRGAPP